MTIYWISEDGSIAYRIDGDPMSDGFFTPSQGVEAWLENKRKAGARVIKLSPPREETWGGPHFGWCERVRVTYIVYEGEDP